MERKNYESIGDTKDFQGNRLDGLYNPTNNGNKKKEKADSHNKTHSTENNPLTGKKEGKLILNGKKMKE